MNPRLIAIAGNIVTEELGIAQSAGATIAGAAVHLPIAADWARYPRARWPRPEGPASQVTFSLALALARVAFYTNRNADALAAVRSALVRPEAPAGQYEEPAA